MWRTKTILSTVIGIGFAGLAFASSSEAVYDRELASERIESFALDNTNGDVKILPTGGYTIQIRAVKRVTGPDRKTCDALVNQLQVETTQLGTNIEVNHSNFSNADYVATIDYTVYLPANIDVKVVTERGQIVCKDRTAEGDFETTNGDINLVNYTGAVQARSENGGITVDGSTSDARFSSANGRLNLTLNVTDNGTLKAETTNGSIHVDLPGDISTKFNAQTTNGSVSCGSFGLMLAVNKSNTSASGKLGNGDANVELTSVNGSISVDSFGSQVACVTNDVAPVVETRYVTVVEEPCYVPVYHPIRRWPVRVVFFDSYPGWHHRWGWDTRVDIDYGRHGYGYGGGRHGGGGRVVVARGHRWGGRW